MADTKLVPVTSVLSNIRPKHVIAADDILFATVDSAGTAIEITGNDLKKKVLSRLAATVINPGVDAAVEAWRAAQAKDANPKK